MAHEKGNDMNIREATGRPVRLSAVLVAVAALVVAACGSDDTTTGGADTAEGAESTVGSETSEGTDSSGASMSADDLDPLEGTFTYFPAFHSITVFVADQAGFWDDLNLDVTMQRAESGANQYSMLVAGQTDWANAGVDTVASIQDEGREMIHFFPAVKNMSQNLVVRNEKLEELGVSPDDPLQQKYEALTEMTIGYTQPGAPTDVFSRFYLSQAGIDPESEGSLVSIGSPGNLIAAIGTGQIDAFMLTPPNPNKVVLEGIGEIFIAASEGEVPELTDYPYTGFSGMQPWLDDPANHEKTVRLVAGLIQASNLIRTDPEIAIGYMDEYFPDMELEALEAGFEDMVPSIPEDATLDEAMVQNLIDVVTELGILDLEETPSAEEGVLWTNQYVEEAQALLESLGQ